MDVGVTGSVAFDHIMSFGGRFQDHILADKIHALNVSFLVNGFEKRRGGCAPNIAYACALHGLHAGVIGTVGHDFSDYGDWLKERGVDLAAVKVIEDHHTASCFITTDRANNQIHKGARHIREAKRLYVHIERKRTATKSDGIELASSNPASSLSENRSDDVV